MGGSIRQMSNNSKEEEEECKEQMNQLEKIQPEVNVEVKQMLKVESKYCTRIRHTISMKSPVPTPIVREDIPVPDARVFLLHNLLTPGECLHYIRETEEICYRDLKSEFEESYRSNERLLVLSETLADYLWRRIQPHLHRNDVIRVRPMCFGNGGSWLPHRLNECFKFGKYQKKQHFGSHIDGPWVPRADESSIYTVLIYLNDNFEGGETVFTPPSERAKLDQEIAHTRESIDVELKSLSLSSSTHAPTPEPSSRYPTDPWSGQVTIQPRQGTALIFTHDTLHAGLPVLAGKKYVLRTEIMFTRRDSNEIPASIRDSYQSDPNYQQTVTFYMDSYAKSLKGDVPGFTNSYLAALKLQHEAQFSVSKDTKAIHELNLPLSLYVHLFTFLDLKDLVSALQCSKSFKDIGKDGSLWKQLYRIRFPVQAEMESHLQQQQRLINPSSMFSSAIPTLADEQAMTINPKDSIETKLLKKKQQNMRIKSRLDFGPIDPAIQDWYTIFKQRILLQHKFEPVIFDFGSFSTKSSLTTPSDTPILELLNLVATIDGFTDIHCRRGAHERYLTGLAVRLDVRNYYRNAKHVIVKGRPDQKALLPELIAPSLLNLSVWSYQHPMIIAEPPFRWKKSTRITVMKNLFAIFRLPALCFVNSGVLSLMSQGLDSGLVAHVGHDTVWVAGVYRRRMISFFDFTPNLESPNAIFNSSYQDRVDEGEMVKDGTLIQQAQVTPEELALRTADAYLDMLAKITDDHHHINFHQIVLCGGGTIDRGFREKYQLGITAANDARRHADITKIRETMLKNANIAATSLGTVLAPAGYIHDLTVILPTHPTHTEVEGGKIFGGLSVFQQHCIRRFEADNYTDPDPQHLEDVNEPSDDDVAGDGEGDADTLVGMYKDLWVGSDWLETQLTYFTIKENFHLDEDAGCYLANSSCDDEEVERWMESEGHKAADAEQDDLEQRLRASLVWRRRRLHAKPRGPSIVRRPKFDDQDGEEEEEQTAPTEEDAAEDAVAAEDDTPSPAPLKPNPSYPMRRVRRSAFPILPDLAVRWFEHQTKVRNLTARTQVHHPLPDTSAIPTAEQKDDLEPNDEDGHGASDEFTSPHFQSDLSTFDAEANAPPVMYWEVRNALTNIRSFWRSDGHRVLRPLLVDPTRSTTNRERVEEEPEDWSEPEEFVGEPTRLVQFKLDYFRGLKAARRFASSFHLHHIQSHPSNSENHFKFVGYLHLVSKIPDGRDGKMTVADRLNYHHGDAIGIIFMNYPLNGKLVTAMVGLTDDPKSVIHFGLLLDCRLPVASDPPQNKHYACDGKTGWLYLFTRPVSCATASSSSSSTFHPSAPADDDLTFVCKLNWQNKNLKAADVVQAARQTRANINQH